ncbi:uncharacterized protein SCHCODRAFT_02491641 [Schizophyllum commune H4-8]|uniref:uncharacterized protein n=1 Tax=Schizophyllum commune (strain H4-8 / FGSC 9210) TaxID=578458 RepID=UPI0021604AE4|nr:uncharacterized protein SCHCODRAFT_02491641 [Schizophyllum commune H4-8]KAI5896361.1 hypothetical protein SCHCODRAFT_02491641 [Schizophyllum commune H4-8]
MARLISARGPLCVCHACSLAREHHNGLACDRGRTRGAVEAGCYLLRSSLAEALCGRSLPRSCGVVLAFGRTAAPRNSWRRRGAAYSSRPVDIGDGLEDAFAPSATRSALSHVALSGHTPNRLPG